MGLRKCNIDWPFPNLYALHPAIGCKRGCFDGRCWALKVNERLKIIEKITGTKMSGWVEDFSKVTYFPDELYIKTSKPMVSVGVGLRSDIFYWKPDYICDVINLCRKNHLHNFYFLTKACIYHHFKWPLNCFLGLTITGKKDMGDWDRMNLSDLALNKNTKFLSIEPLLGVIPEIPKTIDIVIVGAMSGKDAVKPKPEWIKSVVDNCGDRDIYWKKNIKKYL